MSDIDPNTQIGPDGKRHPTEEETPAEEEIPESQKQEGSMYNEVYGQKGEIEKETPPKE